MSAETKTERIARIRRETHRKLAIISEEARKKMRAVFEDKSKIKKSWWQRFKK